ncbi:MAG TPA: Hint domain-containing protein [Candidatus Angelobacter sp.]|jgi:hypothetical protein|nr:Hint domain-containing protein [Candidatus Angelobacter sp.]
MISHQKFLGSLLIPILALLLLPSETTGQVNKGADKYKSSTAKPYKLSTAEQAHLKYIADHTARVITHRLNLADPQQYAYVMDTLRRFGRTPKDSPQLFRSINAVRKGKPGPPVMMTTADFSGAPNNDNSGATLGGLNYITTFGQDTNQNYASNAYSSYPGGQIPYNTQVFLSLFDVNTGQVLNQNQQNVFSTSNVLVPVNAPAPQSSSNIEANALFLITPKNGDPWQAFSVVLENEVGAPAGCQLSPAYSPVLNQQQQCQTNSNTACVGTPTRPISVCYGNRIQSDCDYGCKCDQPNNCSNPPNIFFPIQGNVNLGATPLQPLTGSVQIVLNMVQGGCVLESASNTNPQNPISNVITISGNTASWNLAPSNFPNNTGPNSTPCLVPTQNGTMFNYLFQLAISTTSGFSGSTFTSVSTQNPPQNTFIVPLMKIAIGCFPDGVKIRMADGSERAVEDFQGKGDELVRSSGVNRSVSAITWGNETNPLVYLRDDRGHTLLLTEGHPVMTSRGPVMASVLKAGDVVMTESGNAELIAVERRESPVPVPIHNLRIGTDDEAAASQTTFFANGILVGDEHIQRLLMDRQAAPRHLTNSEILKSLPREWRRDFLNSLKRR